MENDNDTKQTQEGAPPQTPDTTTAKTTETPKKDSARVYTQDELDVVLAKARADEKAKHYPAVEKLKAEKAELSKKAQEVEDALGKVREGKMSELTSVNEELAKLRDQNVKLEKTIEAVANDAAARIREAQLDAFKQKKVAESGITLVELVSGDTEEAIELSIAAAKKREDKLRVDLEASLRKKTTDGLPAPIAPDASHGRGVGAEASTENRKATAVLPHKDYMAIRTRLLQEAKMKAGLL